MDSFLRRSALLASSVSFRVLICAFYSSVRPGFLIFVGSEGLFRPASLAGLFSFASSEAFFFVSSALPFAFYSAPAAAVAAGCELETGC